MQYIPKTISAKEIDNTREYIIYIEKSYVHNIFKTLLQQS